MKIWLLADAPAIGSMRQCNILCNTRHFG